MIHDPLRMRSRAYIAGVVLSVLVLAGAGIAAVLKPHVKLGDAQLVGVKSTGAVYVRLEGRLHPVTNVASGQLILGRHEPISWVHEKELVDVPLGTGLGIAAVPPTPRADAPQPSSAAVCDLRGQSETGAAQVAETSVVVSDGGASDGGTGNGGAGAAGQAVLGVDGTGQHWFFYQGTRGRIDPDDHLVWRALRAAGTEARPVSDHFLAVLPVRPDLSTPSVPAAGEKTAYPAPFDRVGRLAAVEGRTYVATHAGAVQLSDFQAELLRGESVTADLQALDAVPAAATPQWLAHFPVDAPTWLEESEVCASYDSETGEYALVTGANAADSTVHAGAAHAVAAHAGAVALASADGAGPGPDRYVGTDFGTFAVDTGHSYGLVAATGQLFPVPDTDTLNALGVTAQPVRLPWPIIGALEKGPELSRAHALRPVAQPPQ